MGTIVTFGDIVESMKHIGLREGDTAIVHSSLKSFGYVEGGPDTVLDALTSLLGGKGTLIMPTLCQRDRERRMETWDIGKSPSDVGLITEVFRLRPESVRSDHFMASVCAAGRDAAYYTRGHSTGRQRPGPGGGYAFGSNSPWQKTYDNNVRIILIGVDFTRNSTVHFIEYLHAEKALERFPAEKRAVKADELYGWNKPGIWPLFDWHKLQSKLDEEGHITKALCGDSKILSILSRPLIDRALVLMEENPQEWLCKEFLEWREY